MESMNGEQQKKYEWFIYPGGDEKGQQDQGKKTKANAETLYGHTVQSVA